MHLHYKPLVRAFALLEPRLEPLVKAFNQSHRSKPCISPCTIEGLIEGSWSSLALPVVAKGLATQAPNDVD